MDFVLSSNSVQTSSRQRGHHWVRPLAGARVYRGECGALGGRLLCPAIGFWTLPSALPSWPPWSHLTSCGPVTGTRASILPAGSETCRPAFGPLAVARQVRRRKEVVAALRALHVGGWRRWAGSPRRKRTWLGALWAVGTSWLRLLERLQGPCGRPRPAAQLLYSLMWIWGAVGLCSSRSGVGAQRCPALRGWPGTCACASLLSSDDPALCGLCAVSSSESVSIFPSPFKLRTYLFLVVIILVFVILVPKCRCF